MSPLQELQFAVAVFLTQLIAMADHIPLQIQTDDPDIIILQLMEIVVHGKSQVRFPASEVKDGQLPAFLRPVLQARQDVLDKFQKAVDLAELVEFRVDHLSLPGHDSQIHQERHRRPLPEDVSLLSVVGQVRLFCRLLPGLLFHGDLSLFADQRRDRGLSRLHLELLHLFHIHKERFAGLMGRQVPMERLVPLKLLQLKEKCALLH